MPQASLAVNTSLTSLVLRDSALCEVALRRLMRAVGGANLGVEVRSGGDGWWLSWWGLVGGGD